MAAIPAVCPNCARVHELDAQALPDMLVCDNCATSLRPERHGAAVLLVIHKPGPAPERPEVAALLERAAKERKPDRAHALLRDALALDPESFASHRALLYHGRLHETVRKPGDFSFIKCYLLHMYEEPGRYSAAQRDTMVEELLRDPLLERTRALSGDGEGFLCEYLRHLSGEYLRIFVRGRSGISKTMFGLPRSHDAVQLLCGDVLAVMEHHVQDDPRLDQEQRAALREALRQAFEALMSI